MDFDDVGLPLQQPTRKTRYWIMWTCTSAAAQTIGILGGTGSSQIQSGAADPPAVRRQRGQRAGRRRGRAPTTIWTACATPWPWCCRRTSCSPAPSRRTCAGAMRTPPTRRCCACLRAGAGGRLHPELPGQVRHLHRAGRHQRVRRSEAAPVHRPGAAEKAQGPDSGRLHQRRGHRDGRADPQGASKEIPATRPRSSLPSAWAA